MSSDSVRLELELKCYEVSGKRALGAWTGCCWESYGLSSFRFPIAALRHLETCFLPVPWEDRAVFFWQLCHSMHSDVCEFWGLMCKEIGAPQVSLWTPRWQKTMHITGNLGFLVSVKPCICNSLDQSPTVESDRQETWVGISIGVYTLTCIH